RLGRIGQSRRLHRDAGPNPAHQNRLLTIAGRKVPEGGQRRRSRTLRSRLEEHIDVADSLRTDAKGMVVVGISIATVGHRVIERVVLSIQTREQKLSYAHRKVGEVFEVGM